MIGLLRPTQQEIADNALDITQPMAGVELLVDKDRGVVWVNIDGVCALRVCRSPLIEIKSINGDNLLGSVE